MEVVLRRLKENDDDHKPKRVGLNSFSSGLIMFHIHKLMYLIKLPQSKLGDLLF